MLNKYEIFNFLDFFLIIIILKIFLAELYASRSRNFLENIKNRLFYIKISSISSYDQMLFSRYRYILHVGLFGSFTYNVRAEYL